MNSYISNYIMANGITHHYYRAAPAGGGMAVVLLHGLTDNGMCWVRVADALRDRYDVIMPDTRGHGRSDRPESGYDLVERAADVAALIDALGLDRPVLMGHSLGGQVATAVAGEYPDKVRGVIVEDPAWFSYEGDRQERPTRTHEWTAGLMKNKSMTRAALIEECQQQNPLWHADELGPWADAKYEMDPHALEQILETNPANVWRDQLRKAQCPILLLTAEPERGSIITPALAQEAAALWKNGRVAHTPGAGHCIHREQFEPVIRVVEEFLEEVA